MKLEAIEEGNLGEAIEILSRGFPGRRASFWKHSLQRLAAYRRQTHGPPIGRLMVMEGRPVGVILTIASKHRAGGREHDVVNLSSWYVEEQYRLFAPRMLERIVSDDNVLFTDLSPDWKTQRINERLGFHTTARGIRIHFLPWTAMRAPGGGRMIPYERIPPGALPAEEHELLARHRELGCIGAALRVGGTHYAFLFQPTRRKGIPVARLLLAPNRHMLAEYCGTVARFLLRKGLFFMTFHGDPKTADGGGGLLWNRSASIQVKGNEWQLDRIDHTYSELVFLRL